MKVLNLCFAALLLTLFTGLLSGAEDAKSKEDLKKLEGNWKMVRMEGGRGDPKADRGILVDGNKLTFVQNGKETPESFTITLDATKKPSAIDMQWIGGGKKGRIAKGIYQLTAKNELTICVNQWGRDERRPTQFTTKAVLGHGDSLYILKKME
jgi:uncharacterized protein (TIGR03067 family)